MIAEGLRSRTRELLFPGAQVDELGYFVAYATIPRTADDDQQWRMHLAGRGRVVHLRPDDVGSTRAMLSLKSDVRGLQGYRARPPSRLGGPVCWKVRIRLMFAFGSRSVSALARGLLPVRARAGARR